MLLYNFFSEEGVAYTKNLIIPIDEIDFIRLESIPLSYESPKKLKWKVIETLPFKMQIRKDLSINDIQNDTWFLDLKFSFPELFKEGESFSGKNKNLIYFILQIKILSQRCLKP